MWIMLDPIIDKIIYVKVVIMYADLANICARILNKIYLFSI